MHRPTVPNNKTKLKKRSEFLRTYNGKSLRREFFTLYSIQNDLVANRFGVTVPKTVGIAVVRNRYKRWAREVFLGHKDLENGLDIHVFVGSKRKTKSDFKKLSHQEFKKEVEQAIDQICRK